MTAYVDALVRVPPGAYRGDEAARRVGARSAHRWCHLFADSVGELRAFARRIGLRPNWAQVSRRGVPHFDLTAERRDRALAAGALELDRVRARELRRRLRGGA